jgi:hypothetical protein
MEPIKKLSAESFFWVEKINEIIDRLNYITAGQKETPEPAKLTVEETIRKIATEESVDPELAVKVARCESSLNPTALNINTSGSRDRGIFQINDKWHPEVTDAEAFDVTFSTKFFCTAMKGGNLSWWNASRTCWEK